jgi:hypothetical protein
MPLLCIPLLLLHLAGVRASIQSPSSPLIGLLLLLLVSTLLDPLETWKTLELCMHECVLVQMTMAPCSSLCITLDGRFKVLNGTLSEEVYARKRRRKRERERERERACVREYVVAVGRERVCQKRDSKSRGKESHHRGLLHLHLAQRGPHKLVDVVARLCHLRRCSSVCMNSGTKWWVGSENLCVSLAAHHRSEHRTRHPVGQ